MKKKKKPLEEGEALDSERVLGFGSKPKKKMICVSIKQILR